MKLASVLTLRFVALVMAGVLCIGTITLTAMMVSVPQWSDRVEYYLVARERANLDTRSSNFAAMTQDMFTHFGNDMALAHAYLQAVFNQELPLQRHARVYNGDPAAAELPPGGTPNAGYCSYYSKFGSFTYRDLASIATNVFRALFQSNPGYVSLYVGFHDGYFQQLPYQVKTSYPNLQFVCARTGAVVTGYDPSCRGWYHTAVLQPDVIHFSPPYSDATTGKMLITVSRALRDATGTVIGALGFDVSMDTLSRTLLSGHVLQRGYTFLMDQDGGVIIYPGLDRSKVLTLLDVEFQSAADRAAFTSTYTALKAGHTGTANYTKADETWVLAYRPIPNTQYRVGMTVPEADILEPATDMQTAVNGILVITILVIAGVTTAMFVLGWKATRAVAAHIVTPITQFNKVTQAIAQGKLDVELGDHAYASTEFAAIGEGFQTLLHTVRFANAQYFGSNVGAALDNYTAVEGIMQRIGNTRGLGVVYNNKANALVKLKRMVEARTNFDAALDNAREGLAAATDPDARTFWTITLAKRYNNLGTYYMTDQIKQYEDAAECFRTSMELHHSVEDTVNEMAVSGNLGMVYMHLNAAADAQAMFEAAYQTAVAQFHQEDTEHSRKLLQYASMNLGVHLHHMEQYDRAYEFVTYALSLSSNIHRDVIVQCASTAEAILRHRGDDAGAAAVRAMTAAPKHVMVVLDVSQSMVGPRIEDCRTSLRSIVNMNMHDQDVMSLIFFHNDIMEKCVGANVGEKRANLLAHIQSARAAGKSAFYDAVGRAVQRTQAFEMSNAATWIVALTDGEDNESKQFTAETLAQYVHDHHVNLIVITVGDLRNHGQIHHIVQQANHGLLIQAEHGTGAIADAFTHATATIDTAHVNMEIL